MSVYQHVDRESADQSQPSQLGVGRYGDQESAVISANMAIKYRPIALADTQLRGAQITQDPIRT